jgi:hypothetical protein
MIYQLQNDEINVLRRTLEIQWNESLKIPEYLKNGK